MSAEKRERSPSGSSPSNKRPAHSEQDEESGENRSIHQEGENRDQPHREVRDRFIALRAIIHTRDAAIIIGKSGSNIKMIKEQTGARANIEEVCPFSLLKEC